MSNSPSTKINLISLPIFTLSFLSLEYVSQFCPLFIHLVCLSFFGTEQYPTLEIEPKTSIKISLAPFLLLTFFANLFESGKNLVSLVYNLILVRSDNIFIPFITMFSVVQLLSQKNSTSFLFHSLPFHFYLWNM